MKANVRIDNMGKALEGSYSLLWNGPGQWREEITFPGYSEIQIGSKGVIYLRRSTAYMPYQISQLHRTLGSSSTGGSVSFFNQEPRSYESIEKVHEERIGDSKADCVEVISEQKSKREVCVSQSTGVLTREKEGFVDKELMPIGSKMFPRSMSLVEKGKVIVEVHIADLKTGELLDAALFEPPTDALSRPGCMNPVAGRKIRDVTPHYPDPEKLLRHKGTVAIYELINNNGVPQDLPIALTVSPGLDEASLDAVRQWRYEPATCDGAPVETESNVEVHYWMP